MWIGCQWVAVEPKADAGECKSEALILLGNYLHYTPRQSDGDYTKNDANSPKDAPP